MIEITEDYILSTYKRLKNHYYFDFYNFTNRLYIAQFEKLLQTTYLQELTNNIRDICNGKESILIDKLLKNIDIEYRFKSCNKSDSSGEWIIEPNTTEQTTINRLSTFIKIPVELQLLDIIWIDSEGHALDRTLSKRAKGNRLYRDRGEYDPKAELIFAPYFLQYRSWRDNAIKIAKYLNSTKKNCIILSYDVSNFYNSIIPDDIVNYSTPLGGVLGRIYSRYTKAVRKYDNNHCTNILPIGMLSSPVIANCSLIDFDKSVESYSSCRYYGRYVDDIIVVLEGDKEQAQLFEKNFFTSNNSKLTLKYTNQKLTVNKEKVKRIYFSSNSSAIELDAYLQELRNISSEYRLIPEIPKDGTEFHINSIELTFEGAINTFRSITGADFSKSKASKALSSAIKALSYTKGMTQKELRLYSKSIIAIGSQGSLIDQLYLSEKILCSLVLLPNINLTKVYMKNMITQISKALLESSSNITNKQLSNAKKVHTYDLFISLVMSLSINKSTYTRSIDSFVQDILLEQNYLFKKDIHQLSLERIKKQIYSSNMFRNNLLNNTLASYYKQIKGKNHVNKTFSHEIDKWKEKLSPRFIHFYELYLNDIMQVLDNKTNNFSYEGFLKTKWSQFIDYWKPQSDVDIDISITQTDCTTNISINPSSTNRFTKIGVAHISVDVNNSIKAFKGKPYLSVNRYQKLRNILNEALSDKCDILVLPEISIPIQWHRLIANFSRINNMIIIGGFEHTRDSTGRPINMVFTYIPFKIGSFKYVIPILRPKIHYSPAELVTLSDAAPGKPPIRGKNLYTISYGDINFCVFNCFELADIDKRASIIGKVNAVFVIEYNKDIEYFKNISHSLSRDLHALIVQVNAKDYGDTMAVAPFEQLHRDLLVLSRGQSEHVHVISFDFLTHKSFINTNQPKTIITSSGEACFKPLPPGYK